MILFNLFVTKVQAQITNPAIGTLGDDLAGAESGSLFTSYFLRMWNSLITVGALLVIVYFLWGAISWITAGDDSGKIGKARDKMVQSVIGLILLVSSFAVIGFISNIFFGTSPGDFDILNLQFGV